MGDRAYRFQQLPKHSRKRVLKRFLDKDRWSWFEDAIECDLRDFFPERLKELGFVVDTRTERGWNDKRPTIYWSLGCCQGDGMCWEGGFDWDIIIPRFIEKEQFTQLEWDAIKPRLDNLSAKIRHTDNHYYHYNSCTLDWEDESPDPETAFLELVESHLVTIMEKLHDLVDEDYYQTSRLLEREGYDIIDYHHSEDNCKEELANQDKRYSRDGEEAA